MVDRTRREGTRRKTSARRSGAALSAEAWERAALRALARGGPDAVAVEPLARRLGVTKGSFYWHFRDRNTLLRAALARWERAGTEEVVEALSRLPNPGERLARAIAGAWRDPGYRRLEAAIDAAAGDPVVRPYVRRVRRRRLAAAEEILREMGRPRDRAREDALLATAGTLGLLAMERQASGGRRARDPWGKSLERLLDLVARPDRRR